MIALVLGLALALAHGGPAPPDPVVALARGYGPDLEVRRSELRDLLIRMHGEAQLARYAQMERIHARSSQLGLAPTDPEVEREVQRQVDERVRLAFGGQQADWEDELARAGRTRAGYLAERRLQVRFDLECGALAREERDYGPEALRAEWERRYGRFGARFDARTLALRFVQPTPPAGMGPEETARIRAAARAELEARARELWQELRDGADFDDYLERYSTDPDTIRAGYRFPDGFPPPGWPESAMRALEKAQPGDVLEPVYARGSFHIVRIEARHETPYSEDLEPELLRSLREAPPTASETMAVASEVLRGVELDSLEAMAASGPRPADEVVARIDGQDVTREELGGWLLTLLGERELRASVQILLVARRAHELGIEVAADQARARILEDAQILIDRLYGGDRERWWRNYSDRYPDEEAWIRRMIPATEHFLQAEAVMRSERTIGEDQVRALWQKRYGPGGRQLDLAAIRFDVELPQPEPGVRLSREELQRRSDEAWSEALREAKGVRGRLEDGEDFAALAHRFSDDPRGAAQGGAYDASAGLCEAAAAALSSASPGDLVGPLEDRPGSHVWLFWVRGVKQVPFEDVAGALRAELEEARPTEAERARWLNVTLGRIEVQPTPALYGG